MNLKRLSDLSSKLRLVTILSTCVLVLFALIILAHPVSLAALLNKGIIYILPGILFLLIVFVLIALTYQASLSFCKDVLTPINKLHSALEKMNEENDFTNYNEISTDPNHGELMDLFFDVFKKVEEKDLASQGVITEMQKASERLAYEIVDRTQVEREFKKIKSYLSDILDSMPSLIIGVDENLKVTEWNKGADNFTKVCKADAMGRPLTTVFPELEQYVDRIRTAVDKFECDKLDGEIFENKTKKYYFDIIIFSLTTEENKGAVIRLDDVTTQMRLEDMMVQTEKMMSVGGLAAGMAHEINNPLGGILQSIQNIHRRVDPSVTKNKQVAEELGLEIEKVNTYIIKRGIGKFLDGIKESGERASGIVKNMLQFSRQSDNQLIPYDVQELLERSISLAESDYDLKKSYDFKHIEVIREYDPEVEQIYCMPSEVEQVILNLLKNSAQAMNDKYEEQRAKGREYKPRIIVRVKGLESRVHIEIEDNGPGMPEDVRRRVFEPFFTTKEVGLGTGLGLSVSFFIICTNHQGELSVSSVSDEGTKFLIDLPKKPLKTDSEIDPQT